MDVLTAGLANCLNRCGDGAKQMPADKCAALVLWRLAIAALCMGGAVLLLALA